MSFVTTHFCTLVFIIVGAGILSDASVFHEKYLHVDAEYLKQAYLLCVITAKKAGISRMDF